MRAVFQREGLLSAFQVVSSIVPARTPRIILQNIKLSATAAQTLLIANDLEAVGIRLAVSGVESVAAAGEILLPKDRMLALLREVDDPQIHLETLDSGGILVRASHSEFELPGEDPSQYPDVAAFTGEKFHAVAAGDLKDMIGKTLFAAAHEAIRYAATGVMWELQEEKIRLVATDLKRLAVCDGKAVAHGGHETTGQTPVVPTKAMQLLDKNLTDVDEQVAVRFQANDVLFKVGRAEIQGRLVEGRFPPYKDVFPKKPATKIPLPVGPLTAAVRQAAILTDEDSRGVDFDFADGKLVLQARSAERGRAKVDLPIAYDGKPLGVTFDPRYLLEFLRVLDGGEEVMLELVDAASAAVWKHGPSYSYIIVPMTRAEQ